MAANVKGFFTDLRTHFMNGVSFMLPVVVIGGIFLAAALATGSPGENGMVVDNPFMKNILSIGEAGFAMMIPVLAGYIAYSIAGKPGLAPGIVTGFIANNPIGADGVSSGFLGAMILGVLSGYIVNWVKKWKVPKMLRTVMPILVIPVVSTFVVGIGYIYLLAGPISSLMTGLTDVLIDMNGTNIVFLAIIIGLMTAFDMGGPVNKTVSLFSFGLMAQGIYTIQGAHAIAICIPPLGLALATFLSRSKYTLEEQEAGKAAGFMGLIGITEGAIPFAASDPGRVIPSIMVGSAVGSVIGMLAGVANYAPHGGPIVLPVIDHKLWYVIAIIVGSLVTALMMNLLKPKLKVEKNTK